MTLLDAYALVAYFQAEPAAEEVEQLLRDGDCAISAVNLAEVIDFLVRRAAQPREAVAVALTQLDLPVVAVDAEAGVRAGELRAGHYSSGTCEVSLADCVLASVCGEEDQVATSDPALAAMLRAESLGLLSLPDSAGVRP
ncbi:MAG: PIN domain-containing protein [Gaiellales bacterium]